MPPVLGPRSPSKTALWSWADASGHTVRPSVSAKTETSSPSRYSSTTTRAPASPNTRRSSMSWIARSASTRSAHRTAPLPAARPSALTTARPPSSATNARAAAGSSKVPKRAVGMPCRSKRSLAKALELSSAAAAREGPKARCRLAVSASTSPSARGPSGPTTVRSIRSRLTRSAIAGTSSARTGTHSATLAMPGFPGAAYSAPSFGLRDSFQASACSRPPPPTRRTRRPLTSSRRSPRPGRSPPSGCRGRARGIWPSGAAPTFRPLPARAPTPG